MQERKGGTLTASQKIVGYLVIIGLILAIIWYLIQTWKVEHATIL